jgi:CxxC motif-containing protein
MKKAHKFVCIDCPLSCEVELVEEDSKIFEIRNNRCKKGKEYAIAEFINPVRILTTTVRVEGGILPVIPVRSKEPIPKKLIRECMRELAKVKVKAPIKCGDVLHANILNTGVYIASSRDLQKEEAQI